MHFYYDPLDPQCKSIEGAVRRGCEVLFQTYLVDGDQADDVSCTLELYRDDGAKFSFPMKRERDRFFVSLRFNVVGLYFYYFSLGSDEFLGRGALRRAELTQHPESWQVTVYGEEYHTPDWFKGGIMYQIFPDRFCKVGDYPIKPYKIMRDDWGGQPYFRPNSFGKVLNNDFFGGNLRGIRSKLGYLASLHVTTVYLNPIFDAYSNHRYDTGDYMQIDGLLGTKEDFDLLIEDAAACGIRIILDGVFNHTGDDSRYFNKFGRYDSVGAYQSLQSPYADWYHFHRYPDTYDSWWGIETLPAVNEHSRSYQNFICGEDGVVKTWLRRGAAGFRLDVADELPDFFLKKLRAALKEQAPDALIIGEVWEDASNKISYDVRREYLQGDELDSVMNYPLKNAIINFVLSGKTAMLRETIAMLRDNYPKETLNALMNILGTHDTPRILTVFGNKHPADKEEMSHTFLTAEERAHAKELVRMAAVLQFTLFGVPCIYYGDEAGLEGYQDPFCRGCFPWDNIDESLRAFYEKLGAIRTEIYPEVFTDGAYREIYADVGCLIYERKKTHARVIVCCNRSNEKYILHFSEAGFADAFSGELVGKDIELPANTFLILGKK